MLSRDLLKSFGIVCCKILLGAFIVMGLVLPSDALASKYKYEKTVRKSFPAVGIRVVKVENSRGDIRVVGTDSIDSVSVAVLKRVKAGNEDRAREIARMLKFEAVVDGDMLIIKARYPKRDELKGGIISFLFGDLGRYTMNFDLSVPSSVECKVFTASGDVSASNIKDKLRISTASGDVRIKDCNEVRTEVSSGDVTIRDSAGPVEISSASGDIEIEKVNGDVSAQTASGDLSIHDVTGGVSVRTASGDAVVENARDVKFSGVSGSLKARNISGSMSLSASSGDISAVVSPQGTCDYDISTSSGDVVLKFAKMMKGGFMLNAQTASGDISAYLPIEIIKINRNMLKAKAGEGLNRVVIHTASGDIELKKLWSD